MINQCPFFNDNLKDMPATASLYKDSFCKSNNSNCARYIVFQTLGKSKVPEDLFPNQLQKASELIKTS